MQPEVFERLREIIYRESGISLGDEKRLLLQNRLSKRLRELSLSDEKQYLEVVELDVAGEELTHLIDAISTNHTYFFRERSHFDVLGNLLQEWKNEPEIRIWCAASSSGEEPYSLAITGAENLADPAKLRLLASDICTTVLNKAMRGVYAPSQLRELSPQLQQRYFDRLAIREESYFRVKPSLSQRVLFKRLNLAHFPYPLKGPFHAIFCRNVMIYFDNELRSKLIDSFHRLLQPQGYLFVGHSESLSSIKHPFEGVQSAVYRKRA